MLLPAEGAPAMEPSAASALPSPDLSETEGPLGYISVGVFFCEGAPQPMAVEPDTTELPPPVDVMMRGRGLKSGLEGGDMEIAGFSAFISDVNVNEEPQPQVPVKEFTTGEELQAKWGEIVRLGELEAMKDIPREQAIGPLLTFMWAR